MTNRAAFEAWAKTQDLSLTGANWGVNSLKLAVAWAAWKEAVEQAARVAETVPLEAFCTESHMNQREANRADIAAAIRSGGGPRTPAEIVAAVRARSD